MTAARTPPHNLEAEESVIGAMLLSREVIDTCSRLLMPEDFYRPAHGVIYRAILGLYASARAVDTVTVADELRRLGILDEIGGAAVLVDLGANTPALSHAPAYATIIQTHARSRALLKALSTEQQRIYDGDTPEAVSGRLEGALASFDRAGVLPAGLSTYGEVIDDPTPLPEPVIPGLCWPNEALVITSTEGSGKSMFLRQIGGCASQGLHPLRLTRTRPVRVLHVDVENRRRELVPSGDWIRTSVRRRLGTFDDDRWQLFQRRAGMEILSRRGRAELEAVIDHVRPELVLAGPIYRLSTPPDRDYDGHAWRMQHLFDSLMDRYGFSLVLEAHAAKGDGRGPRDLRPKGSSLWLSWPVVCLGLRPRDDGNLDVERLRGERGRFDWPERLDRDRNKQWPWLGAYSSGPQLDVYEEEAL